MTLHFRISVLFVALSLCCGLTTNGATVIWNESSDGDLSKSFATATLLPVFQPGDDLVIASTEWIRAGGGPGGTTYTDYFTIQIPDGHKVPSIFLSTDIAVGVWLGDAAQSMQIGYVPNTTGGELLSQMGLSGESLATGSFGMYVQHINPAQSSSTANWTLIFSTVPGQGTIGVPEPSSAIMLTFGAVSLGAMRLRRKTATANQIDPANGSGRHSPCCHRLRPARARPPSAIADLWRSAE